jgi:glycosyltransferase involved in cell wall biosynthesis|tara:strand:+ start:55 stop:1131 length:1077 start_codon:yes stop_codon:yes gene_type:complete
VEVKHSLRFLKHRFFYIALIVVNAFLVYGIRYRRYFERTAASQWARHKANREIVAQARGVDAVLTLGSLQENPTDGKDGVRHAIVIDHVNLLSKKIPDFGIPFPEREVSASWNEFERRALHSQDRIFVLSNFVKGSIVDDYGIDPEKVTVIGAGPNLDVDSKRDGITKDFNGRNILFVGLDPVRKGLPLLLKAFESVVKVFPDAHLNVVGVEGQNRQGVTYHGRLHGDALKRVFYESQVFAMPSLREPFGIVFLEAMWSQNVCIGTNAFTMPEIIEHGVTGYVVNPQDEVELADRLVTLFSNPDQLKQMAEEGYRKAQSKWSWDVSARIVGESLFPGVERPAVDLISESPPAETSQSR